MTAEVVPVDEQELPIVGSLSPSRAGDFMTCPLLFRYRTIDRLPQEPSSAAVRGTLVHAVLERLFDLPAAERTPEAAATLLSPEWARLQESEPEVAGLFADEVELASWLTSARHLLDGYFSLEDPRRLDPAEREAYVEVVLPGGLRLRGIVDRLDVAPSGDVRVVDYKGLALDTPLPTPSGWTTMQQIRVGDSLIGADGSPCRVTAKSFVHHRPCYEVVFTDGSRVVCDNVHLWSVFVAGTGDCYSERVLSTEDLADLVAYKPATVRGRRRPFIRSTAPLELPPADLPIAPWVLGAWLGDGSARSGGLTVGHPDREDMLRLLKEHWGGEISVQPASERGRALTVSLLRPRPDLCPYGHDSFTLRSGRGRSWRRCRLEHDHRPERRWNASLSELLTRADLRQNKHIPAPYLRASREQRLALLQGLMDTDGSWTETHQRAVFVTTTPALARGVRELVHSLGGTSTLFTKPYTSARGDRVVHILAFRPYGFNPFSLPRKAIKADAWLSRRRAVRTRDVPRELRRTIASVTPLASAPTQCVMVDAPDSLYLCGDTLIPTHNTGRSPGEAFEGKALFQMKFYALVLWRTRGVVPRRLQLMYLGDREVLAYSPDESDLLATERKLLALWEAIERAVQARDFRPRPSKLCDWCDHQAFCPEKGGTLLPWPEVVPDPDEPEARHLAAAARQTHE
jgi:RecB family exonuclease